MSFKKILGAVFLLLALFSVGFFLFAPSDVKAQTMAELQAQIRELEKQLRELQKQQTSTTTTSTSTVSNNYYEFTRDLTLEMEGEDVRILQVFLNARAFYVESPGSGLAGSPGNETTYFGEKTRLALASFQAFHGIDPAVGYFGEITRTKVNAIISTEGVIPGASSGTTTTTTTTTGTTTSGDTTSTTQTTTSTDTTSTAPSTTSTGTTSTQTTTSGTTSTSGSTTQTITTYSYQFNENLSRGSASEEVRMLQRYLNSRNFFVATSGDGSPGNETIFFGPSTESALSSFQASRGIGPRSQQGNFGPQTRRVVNPDILANGLTYVVITSSGSTTGESTTTGGTTTTPTEPTSPTEPPPTTPTGSAPTVNISAKSKALHPGSYSTLNWSSENATSCTASGIWSGNKALSDTEPVNPSSSGSATLTCTGSGGTTVSSASINVSTNIPALSGNTYTLTRDILESTGTSGIQAEDVRVLQIFLNDRAPDSSGWVQTSGGGSPGNESTWFGGLTITALQKYQIRMNLPTKTGYLDYKTREFINDEIAKDGLKRGGTTTPTEPTSPTEPPPTTPTGSAPTLTFGASPSSLSSGGSSTLSWISTNVASCMGSGGTFSGGQAINGTATVSPTSSTTYTLSCVGNDGSNISRSTSVTVSTVNTTPVSGGALKMGTNLHTPTDWSNSLVSTDLMWQARDWWSGTASIYNDGRAIPLDSNGWPTSLQSGQYAKTVLSANSSRQPAGTYTVKWDGEGTVAININGGTGSTSSSNSPFTFQMPSNLGAVLLEIQSTNASNPVRNVKVLVPGATTSDWHPEFLKSLQGYTVLRFMDWGLINNNSEYNGPAPVGYFTLHTKVKGGASPAKMAHLANTVGADMWFNVHDLATPTQVEDMAKMIRDNLDNDRKVYVEWSNEIWNNPFWQAKRALEQGPKMFPNETDINKTRYWYQGVKSEETFGIFESILGDDRVINVIGAQAANVWTAQQIRPYTLSAEAVASAPYYRDAPRNITGWVRDWIINYNNFAKQQGLRHITYEGGQHFVNEAVGGMTVANSIAYNRSEQAYSDYMQYFKQWEDLGGDLFVHFGHIGHVPNNNGSWASFERMDNTNLGFNHPKLRAIRDTMSRWGQGPWTGGLKLNI